MKVPYVGTTRIRNCAVAALCLTLAICLVLVTVDYRRRSAQVGQTLDNLSGATADLREYIAVQKASLEDPRNKRALDAAIQAGAVANGMLRLINTQTIPRVNKGLDALTGAAGELRGFIAATSLNVNGDKTVEKLTGKPSGLLPTATATIAGVGTLAANLATVASQAGVTVGELNTAVRAAALDVHKDLDAIYELIARPEIVELLRHVDGTAANVEKMSASAAEAMKRAPGIAESLEKIARTSSRFTKVTLIANVIGILAKALLP